MRIHAPLDDLIGGKTSVKVLRTLTLFPEKEFTGRELALMAGGAPSRVISELAHFRDLGLVTRKIHGKTHVWKANPSHELFRLLAPAFEREHKLPETFHAELAEGVGDLRISRAILFGSFARGNEKPTSDVDLLVFTKRASDIEAVKERLDQLSVRLGERFGLRLSPIVHAESEFARLRRTALLVNVAAEGRVIKGAAL